MFPPLLGRSLAIAAALLAFGLPAKADILVSDFDNFTTQLFPPMGISWNNVTADQYIQNVGSISITSVSGGNPTGDGYFFAGLPGGGSTSFASLPFVKLTARVDLGNASSVISMELYDSSFTKVATVTFQTTDFSSSFTAATKAVSYTGVGSVSDITYWRISGDGIASNAFRFSLENLAVSAIPEPSAYAIGAAALLGLLVVRREFRKRRTA